MFGRKPVNLECMMLQLKEKKASNAISSSYYFSCTVSLVFLAHRGQARGLSFPHSITYKRTLMLRWEAITLTPWLWVAPLMPELQTLQDKRGNRKRENTNEEMVRETHKKKPAELLLLDSEPIPVVEPSAEATAKMVWGAIWKQDLLWFHYRYQFSVCR